jgi:hypothetical protein
MSDSSISSDLDFFLLFFRTFFQLVCIRLQHICFMILLSFHECSELLFELELEFFVFF